jgi:hypothetical protein
VVNLDGDVCLDGYETNWIRSTLWMLLSRSLQNQGGRGPGASLGRMCRVISSVVVSYRVRPEAVAEHVRLIRAVFEQLHAEQPDNVEYKVVRLADGVSFVHVSSASTPDGSNPLPELAAFKEFGRDSAARVATAPVPAAADIIGSYYPAVPLSDPDPRDRSRPPL